MNCRKGDIAHYVAGEGHNPLNVGRTFAVKRAAGPGLWVVKPAGIAYNQRNEPCISETLCDDHLLRPIRDPGEDATDEVVQRVGAAPAVELDPADVALMDDMAEAAEAVDRAVKAVCA